MELFERADLQRLVQLLAQKLDDAGVVGTISIVGGAAISLQYVNDRDSTTDIDAILPENPIVARIIEDIAKAENLPATWINDAVKVYIPFEVNSMWLDLFSVGGVLIRVASAELLLAMKLRADRGVRDRGDIQKLLQICGHQSLSQVQETYEKFHHQEVMNSRTSQMVQDMLSSS